MAINTVGIVAEYNPFHTGHGYQIAQTRSQLGGDARVIAVMSGNWVQQADCALADKWTRARLALMGGADLVLELPTPWATASAESFARGAVALLDSTGVTDHLCFGSECGELSPLRQVAHCLNSETYQAGLRRFTDEGMPFAACRQAVVQALLGEEPARLLATPNNNLGVEYLRALSALHSPIRPMTIRREGSAHNTLEENRFVSATRLRRDLRAGDRASAAPYLVSGGQGVLEKVSLSRLDRVERAMLARLRTMTAGDWAALPDSGAAEGLPQRLERAGRQAVSLEQFYELAKTKRYTHARLRRLVLWAFLGLTADHRPDTPPYLRVLGFGPRGRDLLREMKDRASLPVLTKPAHARALDGPGRQLFQLEARCTDLYDLCLDPIPVPGREWTQGPVILME